MKCYINYKLLLIFVVLLISISAVYANDEEGFVSDNIDDTTVDVNIQQNIVKNTNNSIKSDSIKSDINNSIKSDSNTKKETEDISYYDENNLTNDCTTTIMQVSQNESLLSFRRDSTGKTINIYVSNNSSYIKQYKTSNSYFFHVLVSKDGWMVGTGGPDSASINRNIESRALTMIKNNRISYSDLEYMTTQHKKLGLGHFIIKAPNGTYGLEIYSQKQSFKKMGILKNGEYIICPNSRNYYRAGNYLTYTKTSDVVKASRLLALKDPYGINRRNIMTYHYKTNLTATTIDFYVANDGGGYVGRRTSSLVDNIVTSSKTVKSTKIPVGLTGLYVNTYKYTKPLPKINFNLTTNKNVTKMDHNITFITKFSVDNKLVNTGYAIYKINGITVKDSKNITQKAYFKNGIATINFTIPDGWSAKPVKVTTVYNLNTYGRLENKTYFTIERSNIHMQLNNVTTTNNTIHIRGKILDEFNHQTKGQNVISVKINGLTIKKDNNNTQYFTVDNGYIDITLKIPFNLKLGEHLIMISTGTRAAYNSNRQTTILYKA